MTTQLSLFSWWRRPIAGRDAVGVGDVVIASLLSAFAILLAGGVLGAPGPHYGAFAAVAVLSMTVPVAWRRQAPVNAAVVLAAGALFNGLVVGRLVRCGPGLPALFFVAFALGHLRRGRPLLMGYAALVTASTTQSLTDPNLGAGMIPVLAVITAGFLGGGRLLASRQAMVARLREHNAELRTQREMNARLAVDADRARIAQDLDVALQQRLDEMAAAADSGRAGADEAAAAEAFERIESLGRETLAHMREVVGALRPEAPSAPQPVLAELETLLAKATTADARLKVSGQPTSLPAGVELSGYRIVEHLIVAMEDRPEARIDVEVAFTDDALELTMRGPVSRGRESEAALAAARERAALHGGTLDARTSAGRREAFVRLPIVTAHA